jgi:hypothetical protein
MSSNDDMTIDRFADMLAAYGGSAARWPAEERTRAERLLHRSSDARALLEEESRLDRMLDLMGRPAPAGETLHAQILDIAFGHPAAAYARAASSGEGLWGRLRAAWDNSGMLRPAGAALAASLMLGVVFGGMVGPASADPDPVDIMELALLDLTFTGY